MNGFQTFTVGQIFQNGGSGNTIQIRSMDGITNPASSVIYFIPDVGANSDFLMTAGAQTITGQKTYSEFTNFNTGVYFSSAFVQLSGVTQVLQLRNGGSGNYFNIRVPTNPSAARFIDITDPGADCALVLIQGA